MILMNNHWCSSRLKHQDMFKHQRDEDEMNNPESYICKGCVEFHPYEKVNDKMNDWNEEKGGMWKRQSQRQDNTHQKE